VSVHSIARVKPFYQKRRYRQQTSYNYAPLKVFNNFIRIFHNVLLNISSAEYPEYQPEPITAYSDISIFLSMIKVNVKFPVNYRQTNGKCTEFKKLLKSP